MTAPLLIPSWKEVLPNSFLGQYGWLPFWYIFVLATSIGGFIILTWEGVLGISHCLLAASLMNFMMPGGAGPLARKDSPEYDPVFAGKGWLPTGYSDIATILYSTLFCFLYFTSRLSTDTKRFCLGAYSDLVVTFMNPAQDPQAFVAVIFDWDLRVNLMGPSMCLFWVVLIAILMSAATFVPRPRCLGGHERTRSCLTMAGEDLAGLALDTGGTLRLLLAYYSHGATHFELESCLHYINGLRSQNKDVNSMLESAWWEAWGRKRKTQLRHLRWLSVFMERLHMVLLSVLVQVKTHEEMRCADQKSYQKALEAMAAPLDLFLAHGDVLGRLASPDCILGSSSLPSDHVEKCIAEAEQCDEALKAALAALQDVQGSSKTLLLEMAFIDGLREWAALLKRFAQGPPADDSKLARCIDWSPHWAWMMPEQRKAAIRNTTSWLLSLLYSVYMADYNSVCVVCVSFIFSSSLGKLWDRNLNRFLGVSMGVLLGNMPSWVCFKGASFNQDVHHPADLVSYIMMMFIIWLVSAYGYFDAGRWSYAFCLLAGIGGVKLLQPLRADERDTWRTAEYNILMDTFVACLITFAVDLFYVWIFGLGTRHQVADSMSSVLDATVSVVADLLDGTDLRLEDLRERTDLQTSAVTRRRFHELVLQAQAMHEEAQRKEATWQLPYKARLATSLLEQFDAISVATYAIRSSAERCDNTRLEALLHKTIPGSLMQQAHEYARTVRDAFNQKVRQDNFSLAELCKSNTRRSSVMVASGFQAGLQLLDELSPKLPTMDSDASLPEVPAGLSGASTFDESTEACSHHCSLDCSAATPAQFSSPSPSNGLSVPVCSLEEKRFQTVWSEVRSACEECESESVEKLSAMLSAMTGVLALRLAMERVEVLLRDEEYWSFGHWGFDSESALERLRSYCPEKAHFCRSHRRLRLYVPAILRTVSSRFAASPRPAMRLPHSLVGGQSH